MTNSNPIGAQMVAAITADRKAAALRALDRTLDERARRGDTAMLGNLAHSAVGTKDGVHL